MKRILAGAATLAATTFTASFTLIPEAYAQTGTVSVHPVPPVETLAFRLASMPILPAHAALPLVHTVTRGDTLAGLAVTYCHGHASDWTGFYHDNEKVIGRNPNLIYPGQRLTLASCTDPPALLHLGSIYRAHRQVHTITRNAHGKVRGVTYGYPNKCGDGDNDGWDVPCAKLRHHVATASASRSVRHSAARRAYSSSFRGRYSRAGLEALWVAAGGPAWAASHAAEIAMCESGGNPSAYNRSGATGLWQILGSVVPGNLYNPYTNARNAVAKFRGGGDTFSAWVCR